MKKFKPVLPRRRNLLSEAYAWERQAGKALPTLAEVQAAYDARMQEDVDPEEEGHVYEEPPYDEEDDDLYEAAKPDFLDLDNDNNKTEPMKKAAADSTANGNYVNKARAKSNLTKKDCCVYGHDSSGKATKLNSTSDVDNPKYKKFTIKTDSTVDKTNEFDVTLRNGKQYSGVKFINKNSFNTPDGGSYIDQEIATSKMKTESLAEAFKKRMIGNLKGSEYILSETFKRK